MVSVVFVEKFEGLIVSIYGTIGTIMARLF